MRLAQRLGGFTDLPLTGQKHQHVAGAFTLRLIHRVDQAVPGVRTAARGLVLILRRPVAHLDRKQPAGDFDHRRGPTRGIGKVAGEALGVERGRGDNDFQIRPLGQQIAQVAKQKIDVQAALVRLVDDQRVVGIQVRIALRLGQQDAIGHQLDMTGRAEAIGEADLVADSLAERAAQFFSDTVGGGTRGNPARLGMADQAAHAAAKRETYLGQLCRLARTRLTADDDHLVLSDRLGNLVAARADRQSLGKARHRQAGGTFGKTRKRAIQPGAQRLGQRVHRGGARLEPTQIAQQAIAIGQHAAFEQGKRMVRGALAPIQRLPHLKRAATGK